MSQQQEPPTNEQITVRLILEHQRLVAEQSALLGQSTNFISFLLSRLNSNEVTNNEPKPSEDKVIRGSPESTE